ncbi:MAG: prolipoprotein diacylglyceryl transferase [Acidobacteriota bacterium]|jgi:phosphatidylglycerol:prolipoprotein diacylglycerol transferase
MHPILVELGPLELPTYGVMLLVGIALGLWTARRRARRVGLDGDRVVDLGLWLILGGLAGAKLLLVITEPSYLTSLRGLWSLLRAGGVFYGGLIGALVAAVILLRRHRLPVLPVTDVLAPSVALGHFFGRLGCFFAGCCYGSHCERPWAVVFTDPQAAEISGTPLGVPLHPVQLYEAAFNLANFFILSWVFARRPRGADGIVLGTYLITYGAARFILEYFRGDADRGFVLWQALSTSQAIAAVAVLAGLALVTLAWRRRS